MKKYLILFVAIMTIIMPINAIGAENPVAIGCTKQQVSKTMGEPRQDISGLKWVFTKDSYKMVFHFDGDILVRGFILN